MSRSMKRTYSVWLFFAGPTTFHTAQSLGASNSFQRSLVQVDLIYGSTTSVD